MSADQLEAFEKAMKKVQWNIDYHQLRLDKFLAARDYLKENPEAAAAVEGFCL